MHASGKTTTSWRIRVRFLSSAVLPDADGSRAVLSEDMIKEAVPGNIRKAEHFVAFLKRFVEYMKVRLCGARVGRG